MSTDNTVYAKIILDGGFHFQPSCYFHQTILSSSASHIQPPFPASQLHGPQIQSKFLSRRQIYR